MISVDISHSRSSTIIVVDDDNGIRETLRIALEVEGYTVITASNGREGIDLLRSIPTPCLILLDLMMPVMNGWEFADQIKRDNALSTIPIVIITAYGKQAAPIKAAGVIAKPIDLEVLYEVVRNTCGSPT